MGDRANVYLPGEVAEGAERGVYLYTHWGGHDLALTVRDALRRCGPKSRDDRWRDPPYLARVIFCEMVGDDWKGVTGYGIAPTLDDNDHPVIRVDAARQSVAFRPVRGHDVASDEPAMHRWTFTEYAELTDEQVEAAWHGSER